MKYNEKYASHSSNFKKIYLDHCAHIPAANKKITFLMVKEECATSDKSKTQDRECLNKLACILPMLLQDTMQIFSLFVHAMICTPLE